MTSIFEEGLGKYPNVLPEMEGLPGTCAEDLISATSVEVGPGIYSKEYGTYSSITGADPDNKPTNTGGWSSAYYVLPPSAKELGDLINHRNMNFNMGNIFKACYRMGHKEGVSAEYDLDKIIWFAEQEKKRLRNVKGESE